MRTRKRSYSQEVETTRRRRKRRCNLNLASSSSCSMNERQINSKIFINLLAEACKGNDMSMGEPLAEEFWTNFAIKYTRMDNGKAVTADSCKVYAKTLHSFYNDPSNHLLHEAVKKLSEKPDQLQVLMPLLGTIFNNQPFLCSSESLKTLEVCSSSGVPESPRLRNTSSKRTNKDLVVWNKAIQQSSSSSLQPEVEMGVQTVLGNLVSRDMLNLRDVADAQTYLSVSTWASNIFLREEDPEKASTMIINAQKNTKDQKKRR